jgi:hypothetical protein
LLNDLHPRRPAMSTISAEVRRLGFQLGFQKHAPSARSQCLREPYFFKPAIHVSTTVMVDVSDCER